MVTEDSDTSRTVTRASIAQNQRIWLDRYGTWQRFHRRARRPGMPLLQRLARYPRCVLVAGCQRSGTTMLTRLLAGAAGFARLQLTPDDELDAALALAGFIDLPEDRRYCFQTTFLNECYADYRTLGADQRLIWVLRNPYSVVYSMLYNWRRFGLNQLYATCGGASAGLRSSLPWPLGPSRLEKACLAYRGKIGQILSIRHLVPAAQLLVVDYDVLIGSPGEWLPRIFGFAGADYDAAYVRLVQRDSANKAQRLSRAARRRIEEVALPIYRECSALAADLRAA